MASQYWGVNRGQHEVDVATGTSSQGTDVEVRVDLTKSLTKEEVIRFLEAVISNYIIKGKWPPS